MARTIEITTAAIGGIAGLAIAGPVGALGGVAAGGVLGAVGVNNLRSRSEATSIYIDARTRREMESTMHIAISAAWGLRPIIEVEPYLQRQIVQKIFDAMVETYTQDVTPYVQEMQLHLQHVVQSGIKPEASMEHVRRNFAPRFMRKDTEVAFMLVKHVLRIQSEHGPIAESRVWFLRWCEAIGMAKHGAEMWDRNFGGSEAPSMEEWLHARKEAALASYHEDDEAA